MTGMHTLAEAIAGDLTPLYSRTRHDVVRSGEREEIPNWVRYLVFRRDGEVCAFCRSGLRFEIDHINPWSAGGCDCPQNLRLLCWRCNQDRSNFATAGDTPRQKVVRVCDQCLGDEGHGYETDLAFCGRCGVVSRAWGKRIADCSTMRDVQDWDHFESTPEDDE